MCGHNLYLATVNVDEIGLRMRHKHGLGQAEPIHGTSRSCKFAVFVFFRKVPRPTGTVPDMLAPHSHMKSIQFPTPTSKSW